jgi:uncharacterized membrane protein (DUF485 family)
MPNAVPLTVLSLIAYNVIGYGLSGADPWASDLLVVPMVSGARWPLRLGDLLVAFALAMLYFEIARTARGAGGAVVNRALSVVVLVAYVAEFVATDVAANSVFFILTAIALVDVFAGFSIQKGRRNIAQGLNADESI